MNHELWNRVFALCWKFRMCCGSLTWFSLSSLCHHHVMRGAVNRKWVIAVLWALKDWRGEKNNNLPLLLYPVPVKFFIVLPPAVPEKTVKLREQRVPVNHINMYEPGRRRRRVGLQHGAAWNHSNSNGRENDRTSSVCWFHGATGWTLNSRTAQWRAILILS